jgi:YfiH family protein
MKKTTLIYLEKDGCYLMMLRNKKKNDVNAGKWIGLGGKFEPGEGADACVRREVYEEAGVDLSEYRFLGTIGFHYEGLEDEDMYLYVGTSWDGDINMDCPEGTLSWISKDKIPDLELWEGDRLFLKEMLKGSYPLNMDLYYNKNDELTDYKILQNMAEFVASDVIKCAHAFSTRLGGISTGDFTSLNLGFGRGDDKENVLTNYRIFGASCGIPLTDIVSGKQVHGNHVRIVTSADMYSFAEAGELIEADGLVTAKKGVPLVIFTADCVPVLLEDPVNGVIGAVHCGWRSTVADIEGEAVSKMVSLGAKPENIRAAIGPAICKDCFETGPEVPEAIDGLLGEDGKKFYKPEEGREGKFLVDLKGAVAERLVQLGLDRSHIDDVCECTMCVQGKYWSHRGTGGKRGSQANVIMM